MTPLELYVAFGAPLLLLLAAAAVYWITAWQDKREQGHRTPAE